jgi:hypothetical protein
MWSRLRLLVRPAVACALAAPAHAQLLERSPIDRPERPIGFADRRDVVRPIAGRRNSRDQRATLVLNGQLDLGR